MSDRNMAVTNPCVQNACGEHSGNMSIIPVEFSEIAALCTATEDAIGGVMQLCISDHRTLHTGLCVGRDHTTWIKGRVKDCGLVEGHDYEVFPETGENPLGGRPGKVYRLSLHAAKEIAMMEGNDKGKLVRRYFIWVEENARRLVETARASIQRRERAPRLPSPNTVFRDYMRTMKMLGFDASEAALAANRATVAETGKDILETAGVKALVAPSGSPHLSPSDIGAELAALTGGPVLSGQKVNTLLLRYGFQEKGASKAAPWMPTEKGERFKHWTVTGKKHSDGTSVNWLRWNASIVSELAAVMAAESHSPSVQTIQH